MARPDTSVFKDQISLVDRQALQQAFELKKQALAAQMQKAAAPSAVQEYQFFNTLPPEQQQAFLNVKRASQVLNLGDQMAIRSPSGGIAETYNVGVNPNNAPQLKGQQQDAKNTSDLNFQPMITQKKAAATIVGKDQGTNQSELNTQTAILPELTKTVGELSELGKNATYTTTGQLGDALVRETKGFGGLTNPATDGAIARTAYLAKVDNQVLPLLRQTFGSAFTEREGASLRSVLGDPNKAPAEKDAALKAFIDQKSSSIQTKQREVQGVGGQRPTQGNVTVKFLGFE